MEVIKGIIEKLKLKEVFAMLFISGMILTFLPENLAKQIRIYDFRDKYQTYISLCIIDIGAYYLFMIVSWIKSFIICKIFNEKKIAIKYMKESMSNDEKMLLVEKFYDTRNKEFKTTGYIEINDGRQAALESRYIIYRASTLGTSYVTFAYNLQPYALEFLNKNLQNGNIEFNSTHYRFGELV